ncbi:hypothetical protein PVAP13_2KG434105 [Panicum virgatum]|uniref:Uncharacterized protein n=1 Tax=Panicum virgatum TaxID=38727 RepID=A0A8T0WK68_PANVG|nr:hypothetical protein PVAP13_2KG434105 [Panicum virgatum]
MVPVAGPVPHLADGSPAPTSSSSTLPSSSASPACALQPLSQPGFSSCMLFPWMRSLLESARGLGEHPGVLFIDLVLKHFFAPVCGKLVPKSSPLLRATELRITVISPTPPPLLSVLEALYFWMGCGSDHLCVMEVARRIYRSSVSSPSVLAFIVSLSGLLHGGILFRFHLDRDSAFRSIQI